MLVAFKEELKRLAADSTDPFHEKVKRRIGKRATHLLEDRLKQVILITPNIMGRIQYYWERKGSEYRVKKLGGFVLAYMYHPQDLLAEDEHGLFGYLDDAYLVASIYEKMLQEMPVPEPEDLEYAAIIAKNKRYIRAVIPAETEKIEQMIKEALGNEDFEMFAGAFSGRL
jgi:uncharacterized membrane protein YkvA (DUF1232 family)